MAKTLFVVGGAQSQMAGFVATATGHTTGVVQRERRVDFFLGANQPSMLITYESGPILTYLGTAHGVRLSAAHSQAQSTIVYLGPGRPFRLSNFTFASRPIGPNQTDAQAAQNPIMNTYVLRM